MARADDRRLAKVAARRAQYERSGFRGAVIWQPPRHYPGWDMGRSKYVPHIGNKERARHAGKPDGVMHGV